MSDRIASSPAAKAALRKATAGSMTVEVGVIEQRLPPRRRKPPSMPQVSLERADGKEAAATAKARLQQQASPTPAMVPVRQHIVEEQVEHVGAGRDRTREPQQRALTQVEKLYRSGSIVWEAYATGGVVRNWVLTALGGSEGVSGYDEPHVSAAPWAKGDRRAEAIIRNGGSNKALAELIFAMAGLENREGKRIFDPELATLVIRACIETTDGVTLAAIGKARTEYNGEKQQQAAGSAVLSEALRRGAMHLRYAGAKEWRDATSWRIVDHIAK
jgi:hypothetical protein